VRIIVDLLWNCHPKEVRNLYPKVEAHKIASTKYGNISRGWGGSKLLTQHLFHSIIRKQVTHNPRCWSHHTRVYFPVIKYLPMRNMTCHKGSSLKHSPNRPLGHLDVLSNKELLHEGRGSTRPMQNVIDAAPHTKLEGRRQSLIPKSSNVPLVHLAHSRTCSFHSTLGLT
jgi:hypothetical protein